MSQSLKLSVFKKLISLAQSYKLFKCPWLANSFYATHMTYSRGVFILLHKSLSAEILQDKTDPDRIFVIHTLRIVTVTFTLVSLPRFPQTYFPNCHLCSSLGTMALYVGDFNAILDLTMDRLGVVVILHLIMDWVQIYGLTEI